MKTDEKKPAHLKSSFECPFCGVYASQKWWDIYAEKNTDECFSLLDHMLCKCLHCYQKSIWYKENMVLPPIGEVPPPNQDLRDDIKEDYNEARNILDYSPRAACAILRLALDKLMTQVGFDKHISTKKRKGSIKNDLDNLLGKTLDKLRVKGKTQVETGKIDDTDDKAVAMGLFELINLITELEISQSTKIKKLNELVSNSLENIKEPKKPGT